MSDQPQPLQGDSVAMLEERMKLFQGEIEQAKTDISSIRQTRGEMDSLKEEVLKERSALKNELSAIQELNQKFNEQRNTLEELTGSIQGTIDELGSKLEQANELNEEISGVHVDSLSKQGTIEDTHKKTTESLEKIKQDQKHFEGLKNETDEIQVVLQGKQQEAKNKVEEVTTLHSSVTDLHNELFKGTTDENGEVVKESLETKIHNLVDDAEKQYQEAKSDRGQTQKEFAELRKELEKEIRSLLPRAGAAGLSSAYFDAKSKYGATPLDTESTGLKYAVEYFVHVIKNNAVSALHYTMFVAPLLIMTVILFDLFHDIQNTNISTEVLLLRVLISFPLVAISVFGWSSIRLSRRLFEEYNHKQRVMQLYHSFKREVDSHGKEEHQQALLSIMLKAVDDKPSLVMQKYDKGFDDILPLKLKKVEEAGE